MSAGQGSPVRRESGMHLSVAVARPGAGPAGRRVIGAGGGVFAVLMVLPGRYGFHHAELYFLACAQRLQASYAGQPVLASAWSPGDR